MGTTKDEKPGSITYRDSGVDIDAGNALVHAIKPLVKATRRPGADADLGGFGGLFDLKAAGFRDPILVAANDGVGTKLKIAIDSGRHTTIGIDLVAMCVNDLVVQGAEPLFFLDYYATGHLEVAVAKDVVGGIAEGCRLAIVVPPVFGWLAKAGRLDDAEMLRTFNCGIGMVAIADKARAGEVVAALTEAGEAPVVLGEIIEPTGEKSDAKGKGEAWAVKYEGRLRY